MVEERPAGGAGATESEGLWPIALLRIAFELKRPGSPGLPEIIDGVVKRMGIEKDAFERYLAENLGVIERQARERG